jgi:hypothetical protein
MLWWDERLDREYRFLLTTLFFFSALAISVGFYFREHYFILLLPVLSLLIAVAVSRSLQLLRGDQSVELFLACEFVAKMADVLLYRLELPAQLKVQPLDSTNNSKHVRIETIELSKQKSFPSQTSFVVLLNSNAERNST